MDAWTASYDPPFTQPQDTSTRRTVRGVMLATGDEIRVEGAPGAAPAAAAGGGRRGGAAGAAPGARGAGAVPANPLSLDNLKTALTLTDAQAAVIAPLLDAISHGQQAVTNSQTAATDARTASTNAIAAILSDAQKTQFAQLTGGRGAPAGAILAQAGGRGARGARGGGGGGGEGASFDYVEITPHLN